MKKFGQFISFDITYNLVKEYKEVEGKVKKWGLGLFLGKNNHNRTVPFAICIVNSETKADFVSLFASFFDIMNSEPQTIITDQQIAIIGALKELKEKKIFEYLHSAMFAKTSGKYN